MCIIFILHFRILKYGYIAPVILASIPGLAVATRIFQVNRFRLWGPGKLFTSITACGIPAITTLNVQNYIEKDVLLGITPCSVCLETRAVSLQMLTGVILPSTIGLMAANHNLVGQSWKKEWVRGICLDKRDMLKCKNIVIGIAIIQAIVVSLIVVQQRSEWLYVRDELARRKESSRSDKNHSTTKMITNTEFF